MLDVRDLLPGSVVVLMEVPPERIHRYGCAAVEPTARRASSASRPGRGAGPAERTEPLRRHRPPRPRPGRLHPPGAHPARPGGENQPTDYAPQEPAAGGTVNGVVFDGLRHDTDDRAGRPSAHGGRAGLRTSRPGAGVRDLAQRVPRGAGRRAPRAPGRGGLTCESPGTRPGSPHTRQPGQLLGRRVHTTVISPVTAPSAR